MKKNSKKIIVSVVLIVVLACLIVIPNMMSKSKTAGTVDVIVEDVDGSIISEKNLDFEEDQTCVELIESNFDNVVIDNGMLMSIETLDTPSDWSYFICIYVDDEMSSVGIEEIELKDGMDLSFIMTENEY